MSLDVAPMVALYVPIPQRIQTELFVAALVVEKLPATHVTQSVSKNDPVLLLYVPIGHDVHESREDAPIVVEYVPEGQEIQAELH